MWKFKIPTKIEFGCGAADELTATVASIQAGARVVVATDGVLAGIPAIRERIDRLRPAALFADIQPNPTVANVDALTRVLRDERADGIVAIGGGSSMDCAKAAACLARSDGTSIRAYHSEGAVFRESDGSVPLIAVPTTAGTGSEVTPFAVLNDEGKGVKGPIACDLFYPRLAVVDPQLSAGAPLGVTVSTALDALSHALEGYWSKNHQPICDLFAIESANRIFTALPKVYTDPSDLGAREDLAYAALLAGLAFQLPKNAILHACSFPLSAHYHLPHGAACAFLMEQAIRFNACGMDGRLERFADGCGFRNVNEMADAVRDLKKRGGLPCKLADAEIPAAEIDELVKQSFHPLMNNNPVDVSADDLKNMYKELVS